MLSVHFGAVLLHPVLADDLEGAFPSVAVIALVDEEVIYDGGAVSQIDGGGDSMAAHEVTAMQMLQNEALHGDRQVMAVT